jgi:transposase-like protein
VVLDLRLVGQETATAWGDAITALVARGLRAPVLAVIDGNPGLYAGLQAQWPGVAIQRCTVGLLKKAGFRERRVLSDVARHELAV